MDLTNSGTKPGKGIPLGSGFPNIERLTDQARPVRLKDLSGDGWLLVYFFPMAHTPGCTMQACNLRDDFHELSSENVRVVGVSSDSPRLLASFRKVWKLPFDLLSDRDGQLAKGFGVKRTLGFTSRCSFLFRNGKLHWKDLHASPRRQAQDVREVIQRAENQE